MVLQTCKRRYLFKKSNILIFSPPLSTKHLMRWTRSSSLSHCWIMLPMSTSERLQVFKSPPSDVFSPLAFPVSNSKTSCHICFFNNSFMMLLAQAWEMLQSTPSGTSARQTEQNNSLKNRQ